jgi:hypothetical protein
MIRESLVAASAEVPDGCSERVVQHPGLTAELILYPWDASKSRSVLPWSEEMGQFWDRGRIWGLADRKKCR